MSTLTSDTWQTKLVSTHSVRYRRTLKRLLRQVFAYLILIPGAVAMLIPVVWMVLTCFKQQGQLYTFPPKWWPDPWVWTNFSRLFGSDPKVVVPFDKFLVNTIIITFTCLVEQVLAASLVAYGFGRLRFPGKDLLFIILLGTMMLPSQVTIIPTYMLFSALGWVDTWLPLLIPPLFGGGAFFIFLLRQFFLTIPIELEDAARIDGCNTFQCYWRIMLPLSLPVLTVVGVFSFIGHWNDFFGPLIYLNSLNKLTLAVGLSMLRGQYGTDWTLLMPASLMMALPCIILFMLFQRYFIQGIVMTGIKG